MRRRTPCRRRFVLGLGHLCSDLMPSGGYAVSRERPAAWWQVQREEVLAEAQRIPGICATARNIAGDQLSLADGRISLSLPKYGPIGPGLDLGSEWSDARCHQAAGSLSPRCPQPRHGVSYTLLIIVVGVAIGVLFFTVLR